MKAPDELRAKAREAARAAHERWPKDHSCIDTGTDRPEYIADAVLSAILPELDARVRAAREDALEEAAKVCDAYADELLTSIAEHPDDDDVCESLADAAGGARGCGARIEALSRNEHREREGDDRG